MYSYYMPTTNIIGSGSLAQLPREVKIVGGKHIFLVTGKSKRGADKVVALLENEGIRVTLFSDLESNPTDKNVEAGLKVYQKSECDAIVALGGGSPIDCAKAIGLLATNGGKISDYEGLDKSTHSMPPFIAINTTAGSASEMTRFTIITDSSRKVKMAIVDWHVTPNISINDPQLMISMPSTLTAATGMDALTHAIEAYLSTIATPLTDSAALKSIALIADNLPQAVANGENLKARENMVYAEFLAGMAFNNASLGYVHAMAHQLGGFYGLAHGVCNAVLLPHVAKFNIIAAPERFVDIAHALGENVQGLSVMDAANSAIAAITQLAQNISIPSGLASLGVQEKDFELLAENALKDVCALTNPRKATKEDIVTLFKVAL